MQESNAETQQETGQTAAPHEKESAGTLFDHLRSRLDVLLLSGALVLCLLFVMVGVIVKGTGNEQPLNTTQSDNARNDVPMDNVPEPQAQVAPQAIVASTSEAVGTPNPSTVATEAQTLGNDAVPSTPRKDVPAWPIAAHDTEESDNKEVDVKPSNEPTREPVWGVLKVSLEYEIVAVQLDFQFTAPAQAEGFLQLYWDDEVIGMFDQRLVTEMTGVVLMVSDGSVGDHTFAFRLDGYGDQKAGVQIRNVVGISTEGIVAFQ